MSESVSMAATRVDNLMENNENVPPCPASNPEEIPLESNPAVNQTKVLKSTSLPRGRPKKSQGKTPDSLLPSKRLKKNSANTSSKSKGKKLDFSPLRTCQPPGEKISTPVPKSESGKPSNSNSCDVRSDSCTEDVELRHAQDQCALNTEGNIMVVLSPNDAAAITPTVPKMSNTGGSNGDDTLKKGASETCTSSAKRSLKRKRSLFLQTLDSESRESHIQQFQQEIESLFKYFNESFEKIGSLDEDEVADMGNAPTNVIIARHLEDSRLSYTKLVEQIHEKLKNKLDQNGVEISLAFVKSSVLLIGQRPLYGIPSTVADVLEDDSESCLWCWEVRDLKLLPKSQRDFASVRRRCRKKIHERVTALSAMVSALSSLESEGSRNAALTKAEDLLMKADDEIRIRAMVADLMQKCLSQMMVKQAKKKEKEAIKEKERNGRKCEKEQQRLDRELRKEKIQQEREQARAQREAHMHEKEIKRQQEEAEKEQRRREKEEAEMKKQLAIQKQATIMDRFLQSKKESTKTQNVEETTHKPLVENVQVCSGVMALMDKTLLQGETQTENLLRSHLATWRDANNKKITRNLRWGKRRKPKVVLFNELRLQRASAEAVISEKVQPFTSKKRTANDIEDHEFKAKNAANDWEEQDLCDSLPDTSGSTDVNRESMFHNKRRKLLQFDKAYRPPYYGTFSKKSDVVGPRHPFKLEPSLDYENDSDEEWEEEDPGESLSDADEDDEEEKIEVEKEKLKCEEDDDIEDGFLVPDGYLSESEGVCLDDTESDVDEDSGENVDSKIVSQNCGKSQQLETESEWHAFEQQQKVLENATDRALRSGRVFIVSNLFRERNDGKGKAGSPDLNPRQRLEQTCLQALQIQICSPEISIGLPTEPSTEASIQEDQEPSKHQKKISALSDSDLPMLVSIVKSSTQGINKIVESLLTKFPDMAKRRLKDKIREIADFTENRWQVKKHVLEKLNMPPSPVRALEVTETPKKQFKDVVTKSPTQSKGIATYFLKRCLPPEAAGINIESSPENVNFEKLKDKHPAMVEES